MIFTANLSTTTHSAALHVEWLLCVSCDVPHNQSHVVCTINKHEEHHHSTVCEKSCMYQYLKSYLQIPPDAILHCKKERVVLTNFGHLSCTQNRCKSLGKVAIQNMYLHTNITTHLEKTISLLSCLPFEMWSR